MKKADIIVGGEYAYRRRRYEYATKVEVIDRADIPADTYVRRADSNGNVFIKYEGRSWNGDIKTQYECVASRYIVSTWADEEVRQADAKAASDRRAKQQAVEEAARKALLAEFAEDIDAAGPVLDSLGLPEATLDKFWGYQATIGTYNGSRSPQVLMSRKAFNALIAAVRDNVTEVAA